MKLIYVTLFSILFLTICATSADAAVIYGGKLFHSQNFTTVVGGDFIIYGMDPFKLFNNKTGVNETHYRKVFIRSDIDDDIELLNGTCDYTLKYKYCYKGASIDFSNPKTFEGLEIKSVVSITIESLPPSMTSITIGRKTKTAAYCGEWIKIPINISNGGTMVTNVTYSETLPENTLILEALGYNAVDKNVIVVDTNILTIRDRLMPNSTKSYYYTMVNFDCQSKNWSARYSYVSLNGTLMQKNLTNLALIMNQSYKINQMLIPNKTNSPMDITNYTFTINNTHSSADILLDLAFTAPGMTVVSTVGVLTNISGIYQYKSSLIKDGVLKLSINYRANEGYKNYTIYTTGTITVGNYKYTYNHSDILQVVPPLVIAYLDINNTPSPSLAVNIWARNDNIKEKYYYLNGTLTGMGTEELIYSNSINPGSKILLAKKVYNITGMGVKDLEFEFVGTYRDSAAVYDLYDAKAVTINGTNYTVRSVAKKTTVKNVTKTPINKSTTIKKNSTSNETDNTDSTSTTVEKKDLLTRIIEGLNKFFQSIFG